MTTDDDYQTRLDNIKTTFSLAKDEYISTYPNSKLYPNVSSYQDPFINAKNTINSINADLFVLENETGSRIENLSNEIEDASVRISDLKNDNKQLEEDSTNMKGSDQGSKKRYIDSQQRSFLELYSSVALGVIAFFTFTKMRNLLNTQ